MLLRLCKFLISPEGLLSQSAAGGPRACCLGAGSKNWGRRGWIANTPWPCTRPCRPTLSSEWSNIYRVSLLNALSEELHEKKPCVPCCWRSIWLPRLELNSCLFKLEDTHTFTQWPLISIPCLLLQIGRIYSWTRASLTPWRNAVPAAGYTGTHGLQHPNPSAKASATEGYLTWDHASTGSCSQGRHNVRPFQPKIDNHGGWDMRTPCWLGWAWNFPETWASSILLLFHKCPTIQCTPVTTFGETF